LFVKFWNDLFSCPINMRFSLFFLRKESKLYLFKRKYYILGKYYPPSILKFSRISKFVFISTKRRI
jgi:hypothetical protein